MNILLWPDPVLLKSVSPVVLPDPELPKLIEDMYSTMKAANGIGLAANQVGVNKRVLVLDVGEGCEAFVNPKQVAHRGLRTSMPEGCLSVPGFLARVDRYKDVHVEYEKPFMGGYIRVTEVFTGPRAHVLQHEIEHLNGHIFVEHLNRALRFAAKIHMQKRSGVVFRRDPK